MLLRNRTPFIPLVFESQDQDGDDFYAIVFKGTFCIVPGEKLRLLPEQEPLLYADEFTGEVGRSSVRWESDVVPHKPATDVVLNTVAYAPGNCPAPSWTVSIAIGQLHKALRVTGPRYWTKKFLRGWVLSDPEPCLSVPLCYEKAFGGTVEPPPGVEERAIAFEENPVGTGFVKKEWLEPRSPLPAPQIESLDDPICKLGQTYKVEGLGPIGKSWSPRLEWAGTYDQYWQRERWPKLPEEFDFRYYNGAHPDLIYPGYTLGNEAIRLQGLSPQEELQFQLPGYILAAIATDEDDYSCVVPMNLDTINIDVPNLKCYLVWRGALLKQGTLEHIEARMDTLMEVARG